MQVFVVLLWVCCWRTGLAAVCTMQCVLTQRQCNVCFQVCLQNSTNSYSFYNCSQPQSASGSQGSLQNGNVQNQILIYGLSQCGSNCCGQELSVFQNEQLSQCQTGSSSASSTMNIIIGSVVGFVVLVSCFICGSRRVREKVVNCFCEKKGVGLGGQNMVIDNSRGTEQKIQVQHDSKKSQNSSQKQKVCGRCVICLDQKSNVLGCCGQSYHFRCLREWYLIKQGCPFCKSAQMKVVKLYCLGCKGLMMERGDAGNGVGVNFDELESMECRVCKKE